MGSNRGCLSAQEVPVQYRERYINTNYRKPYSSAVECIINSFKLNNETFNIWTHLIPLLFLPFYFSWYYPDDIWPLSSIPTFLFPLLSMEISVCVYLLGSTVAHVFNCMSPRIRHICFYVDYSAISMFGVGGACTTFYYLRPLNTGLFLFESPNLFIGGASLCCIFTVYITCASRHRWEQAKYVVRTLAFTIPFLFGNSPFFVRFLMCFFKNQEECSFSLVYLFTGCVAYMIAAIFNATRVPERFFPNRFDVFGHNHQWVHIITTIGTLCHYWGVQVDLEARKHLFPILLQGLTAWSSLVWVCGTFLVTLGMALWFGSQLTREGHLKSKVY